MIMVDPRVREFFETVETGVVTDAMYLLNIKGWMHDILPFRPNARIFGPAFTVQASYASDPKSYSRNYSVYDLSEHWNKGDVLVIDGLNAKCALMGDQIGHVCQYGGLSGVVLNGRCRDVDGIRNLKMPIFGRGPAIQLGKGILNLTAYNVPLNVAGAHVNPGDYILGDNDGVLVFPADRAIDIMYQAEMVIEVEKELEQAIRDRQPVQRIKEIVKKKAIPRP